MTIVGEKIMSSENPYDAEHDLRGLADELLETRRVEYVDEEVLLVMAPPGFEHGMIIRSIFRAITLAFHTALTSIDWVVRVGDFQWEFLDGTRRFYVPDMVVTRPEARNNDEQRKQIALIVEVTSPKSPDTVLNDREIKPKEYAKAGIPLYLLVDQEKANWVLYALAEGRQRYQIAADGRYGDDVPLPEPFGFAISTNDWPRYEG
ncbi:MAG TPA: Uma2 family endonuclease [Streptosporangiaceae bacterium]